MNLDSASAAAQLEAIWQSIRAMTSFAQRGTGADSFALFEVDRAQQEIVIRDSDGAPVQRPEKLPGGREVASHDDCTRISFPLQAEHGISGLLTFVFRKASFQLGVRAMVVVIRLKIA